MATQKLLNTLAFRSIKASTTNIASISVKFGSSREQGHTSARKFFKNYLPIILYHNPDIKANVEKYKSSSSSSSSTPSSSSSSSSTPTTSTTPVPDPLILVTKTDGSTVEYNLKNVIADLQKKLPSSSSSSSSSSETPSSSSSSSSSSGSSPKRKVSPKSLEPDTWIFQQLTGSNERLPETVKRSTSGNRKKSTSKGTSNSNSSSSESTKTDEKSVVSDVESNNSGSSTSKTGTTESTPKKDTTTATKAKK